MREIKFRVWLKDHKILGLALGIDILHKEIFFSNDNSNNVTKYYGFVDFKEIELMQYTGIKDRNEKEIYEGDILSNDEECYKVVFENGSYRAEIEEYSLDLIDVAHCCEIVGNIYENPELLAD